MVITYWKTLEDLCRSQRPTGVILPAPVIATFRRYKRLIERNQVGDKMLAELVIFWGGWRDR